MIIMVKVYGRAVCMHTLFVTNLFLIFRCVVYVCTLCMVLMV